MPVTYTVTASDVASVSANSALREGTIFDWTNQVITFAAAVSAVDAQTLIDNARFAESTAIGVSRKSIVQAFGKYKKGVDPVSGLDIFAGVEAILLDGWKIATAKTTGIFLAKDIYRTDGSFPVIYQAGVEIRYQSSIGLALAQVSSGTGDSVWSTSQRDQVLSRTAKVDGLIENVSGDRFTSKALERSPTSTSLDAAGVRSAIGLSVANLDTQLGNITGAIALLPNQTLTTQQSNWLEQLHQSLGLNASFPVTIYTDAEGRATQQTFAGVDIRYTRNLASNTLTIQRQ
jgi:hypothetical protein